MARITRPLAGILGLWLLSLAGGATAKETAACSEANFRYLTDGRGIRVRIPDIVTRVVTVSDGMVEQVMTRLGVADTIVATGSECLSKKWSCTVPGARGKGHTLEGGMHAATYLNPRVMGLPVVAGFASPINYERLASLKPDLVIARIGDCPLSSDRQTTEKCLALVASLGIPVVALLGPNAHDSPDIRTLWQEIRILGQVFSRDQSAENLICFLEETLAFIQERTRGIPASRQKKLLLLGLSPMARKAGGAGIVKGAGTFEAYLMDEFVNAGNAYDGPGAWVTLNTEQILALDPDAVILVTAWGYHPPEELYDAPYYKDLGHLRAVRNRSVAALPFTPCNCERRLAFPLDLMVMAKTAYPERFKDIDLAGWVLDFYRQVYGIDTRTAKGLRSCQWMNP